jgi:hypothetical protein
MRQEPYQSAPNGFPVAVGVIVLMLATNAQAAITVSSQSTQNMACANGLCEPTAKQAVLNVGDLEGFLASGNLTVTTTGAGVQADDIRVSSALVWSNSSTLSLQAHRSIAVNAGVSVAGLSGVTLDTGKNGTLSFGKNGNATFANLASSLTINGISYTLVGDIKTLATDIANSPSGNFALANAYDASVDGTYEASPIGTLFNGSFDGLGNNISNLSIAGATDLEGNLLEGLFAEVDANGELKNIGLVSANIVIPGTADYGATLAGWNLGTIQFCYASGIVSATKGLHVAAAAGGLVGASSGTIENSFATANVTGSKNFVGGLLAWNSGIVNASYATGDLSGPAVGGLVGENDGGAIMDSYAAGNVRVNQDGGHTTWGGGIVGNALGGTISNSYATGTVSGKKNTMVGGLVGVVAVNGGTISDSYSTGVVVAGTGSYIGGSIGYDFSQPGSITNSYWDVDTSGITNLSQGAGNIANDPGITGLTTAQFQSGLPQGFDPNVWAEKSKINGGLPYLISNPPPKQK